MSIEKTIASLSSEERVVLPVLLKEQSLSKVIEVTSLQHVKVVRALQWLENKGLAKVTKKTHVFVVLGKNGEKYKTDTLPEVRLLKELSQESKSLSDVSLPKEEIGIALGILKKNHWVDFKNGILTITKDGTNALSSSLPEQDFLQKIFPLNLENLSSQEKSLVEELKKRKDIILIDEKKSATIKLTPLGEKVANSDLGGEFLDSLTPEMIKSGSWKEKKFRRYDVEVNVPSINGGRRHFANKALEYTRQIWLDLGFQEMSGDFVQTSFWNFDALFTAQDHPVREMQDTFFLDVLPGKLPEKGIVKAVKNAHESGVQGSSGWGGKWSEAEAKKVVLRTHTTVLSALTLAKNKSFPAKYFALGRCFRNEALDWSHLFEFNQTEGIVIDPNANFTHLLGYLREFFKKMGFEKARFRPAYFPYTEPSVEIDVFHPQRKKWVEMGGAGMLRPEVVIPLMGKDIPVLAWGPGIDRLLMDYYELNDLRNLYSSDLNQIRKMKEWIKCQQ